MALFFLATAYVLAAIGCLLAARALWVRGVTDPARAMLVWWIAGASLTAMQAVEAMLLAAPSHPTSAFQVVSLFHAPLVGVALAGFAYASVYAARGQPPPLPLVAMLGAALMASFVSVSLQQHHDERLVSALLRVAPAGPIGLGLMLAVPLLGILPFIRVGVSGLRTRESKRAALLAAAIVCGAAGLVLALVVPWSSAPLFEAIGVAGAGALAMIAYVPSRPAAFVLR